MPRGIFAPSKLANSFTPVLNSTGHNYVLSYVLREILERFFNIWDWPSLKFAPGNKGDDSSGAELHIYILSKPLIVIIKFFVVKNMDILS